MVDDSPEPEKIRATRLALEHLVSIHGLSIRFSDRPRRTGFVPKLSRKSGVDPEVVGFALCGLDGFPTTPAFFRAYLERYLRELRECVVRPDYLAPRDPADVAGEEGAKELLQQITLRFGSLLKAWPEMVAAAREPRGSGDPISETSALLLRRR